MAEVQSAPLANIGGRQTSSLAVFTATFDGVNSVTIARP